MAVELTPANVQDLTAAEHLTQDATGYLLGDRNYWSPRLTSDLAHSGLTLLAPYKSAKRETHP